MTVTPLRGGTLLFVVCGAADCATSPNGLHRKIAVAIARRNNVISITFVATLSPILAQ